MPGDSVHQEIHEPLLEHDDGHEGSQKQWKDMESPEMLELPISTGLFMAKRTIMCWLIAFGFFNVYAMRYILRCVQGACVFMNEVL